jgi:hypothetical protein
MKWGRREVGAVTIGAIGGAGLAVWLVCTIGYFQAVATVAAAVGVTAFLYWWFNWRLQ